MGQALSLSELSKPQPREVTDKTEMTAEERQAHYRLLAGNFLACFVITRAGRRLLSRSAVFRAMTPDRQHLLEQYVLSVVNAVVSAGLGFGKLARNKLMSPGGALFVVDFMMSYFAYDLVVLLTTQGFSRPADMIHHVLGIVLLSNVAARPNVYGLVAPFCMVEGSTLFLNAAFMLKELGLGSEGTQRVLKLCFAGSFAVLRTVWLPFFTWVLAYKHPKAWLSLGVGRFALVGANAIQFYWMRQIVRAVAASS